MVVWSKYCLLAYLDFFRLCMAASISCCGGSSNLAHTASSDSVSSIPSAQLVVFYRLLSSSIWSIAPWPNIRRKCVCLVIHLTVNLLAPNTARRCSIHNLFRLSQEVVSCDSASGIGLCHHLITPLPAAWSRVTGIIWILQHLRRRSVYSSFSTALSATTNSRVPNQQITSSQTKSPTFSNVPCFSGCASAHLLRWSLPTNSRWYPSSILGMHEISIPTHWQRQLMDMLFKGVSYCRSTNFLHCSHILTQSLTSTHISGHQ